YSGACASRNSYTSVRSTPVKVPVGIAASSEECRRALGHAALCQRSARISGGRRQQAGSGQVDARRTGVSRPRNHLTCTNGVPTLTEKEPLAVDWMLEVHQ